MLSLVCQCGVEAFGVTQALDWRILNVLGFLRAVGPATAIMDVGLGGREERIGMIDALDRGELRFGFA